MRSELSRQKHRSERMLACSTVCLSYAPEGKVCKNRADRFGWAKANSTACDFLEVVKRNGAIKAAAKDAGY